jgi:hypothetical protein
LVGRLAVLGVDLIRSPCDGRLKVDPADTVRHHVIAASVDLDHLTDLDVELFDYDSLAFSVPPLDRSSAGPQ